VSTELVPISDIERMATAIAKSGFFGVKTVEQAVALMLIAQAEGLHPAIAARDYHVIQGRPALKADAMLARFQQAGGSVQWTDLTDKRVAATFTHPQGGSVNIDWDMTRAKAAGLTGKDNWSKYPRQMLRARCISEGIRTVYPGVLSGMYTPEEVQDFDNKPAPEPVQEAVVVEAKPAGNGHDPAAKKFQDDFAARWKWFKSFHAEARVLEALGAAGYEKASEIPAADRASFIKTLDALKAEVQREPADKTPGIDKAPEPAAEIDAPITEEQQLEFEEAKL